MEKKQMLVLYHDDGGCLDGFASAAVVHDFVNTSATGYDVEYLPISYGDPIPDMTGKKVFVVDFAFGSTFDEVVKFIDAAKMAEEVTILDHHATACENWLAYMMTTSDIAHPIRSIVHFGEKLGVTRFLVGDNITVVFGKQMSGSVLTWRWLNISKQDELDNWDDNKTPVLLKYCQDWDLHTLKCDGVKEIVSALYGKSWIIEKNFDDFLRVMQLVQVDHEALVEMRMLNEKKMAEGAYLTDNDELLELYRAGKALYEYQVTMSEAMIARSVKMRRLCGYEIPVMYCPRELRTIAGGLMAKGHPFALLYEDCHVRGKREYSFRSDQNNPDSVNVRKIADQFGAGGGHAHAAGLKTSIGDSPIWEWNTAGRFVSSPHD